METHLTRYQRLQSYRYTALALAPLPKRTSTLIVTKLIGKSLNVGVIFVVIFTVAVLSLSGSSNLFDRIELSLSTREFLDTCSQLRE